MQYHFGVQIREGKHGLKLKRENYAIVSNKNSLGRFNLDIYANEEGSIYSNEWCEKQIEDCLINFDLNMEYFSLLDHNEFDKEINEFIITNRDFVEVYDLKLYDKKPGYYLMILDEYCQAYIGTTFNIKKRIRQHWTRSIPFDRLLFPMGNVDSSILSIDSFRSLDTTRIFAFITSGTFIHEDELINQFSSKFTCNRLAGGRITGGLLQATTMIKKRDLVEYLANKFD